MLVANTFSNPSIPKQYNASPAQAKETIQEPASQLPEDSVTLSSQKDNSTAGLVTMICGLMIGAGIASAAPIAGAGVMLGSIYAGLAMAS